MSLSIKEVTEMQRAFNEFKELLSRYPFDEDRLHKLQDRMDQLELSSNRRSVSAAAEAAGAHAHERSHEVKEYLDGLRHTAVTGYPAKVLSLGDDAGGGYLAPPEYANDVIVAKITINRAEDSLHLMRPLLP